MKFFIQAIALVVVPLVFLVVLNSFATMSMDQLHSINTHFVQRLDYPSYMAGQR